MSGASPISGELQSKIALWRMKIAEGTITQDEMKEVVRHLRAGRLAAAQASTAAKRKRAIAEIPAAEDFLKEMDDL